MAIDAIIISVLYKHFYNMKQKGRNVIPWFQTVSVIAFLIILMFVLLSLIFLEISSGGYYDIKGGVSWFIIVFIIAIVITFLFIKRVYFDTNKHLTYLDELNSLPTSKQKIYKITVLSIASLLPFLLLFVLYLFDKRAK